jgi:NAD(P)-dependent dehydrogenase (short-subunit alcohol dehydrogenase family)
MSNPLSLAGQRVLITGAASGIGLATARLVRALDGAVVAIDRDASKLDELREELTAGGGSTHVLDLSELERIPSFMSELARSEGTLSGLVHAAGLSSIMPTRLLTPERYRDVLTINTEAALALLRGFQNRSVCREEGGSVVFISSVMGLVGSAGASAYAMSKAALIGLTKSAALEYASRQIRVNCVAPGFVKTAMYDRNSALWSEEQRQQIDASHPLGLGEAEDVANAIAFLLAGTARWITGTVLVCDGGYTAS